jgi:uncharacterized membrane protein YkoI
LPLNDKTVIRCSPGIHVRLVSSLVRKSSEKTKTNDTGDKNITMKIKNIIGFLLAVGLLAGCASERHERHEDQAKLQAEAKVTRADAEKVALTQAPNGTVKEGELEREHGKLIWSFDIVTPDSKDITEVAVDAITGAVVAVEKETPEQQAKEKAEEAKKGKKD